MIALDDNGGCSYAMIGGRPVVGGRGSVGATTSTYDCGSYDGREAQVVELPQLRTAASPPPEGAFAQLTSDLSPA